MKTQLLKLLFKSKVTAQNTNLFEIAFPPNSSLSRLLSINAKASHDPQLLMGQNIYKSQRNKNKLNMKTCRMKFAILKQEKMCDKHDISRHTNFSVLNTALLKVKSKYQALHFSHRKQ